MRLPNYNQVLIFFSHKVLWNIKGIPNFKHFLLLQSYNMKTKIKNNDIWYDCVLLYATSFLFQNCLPILVTYLSDLLLYPNFWERS